MTVTVRKTGQGIVSTLTAKQQIDALGGLNGPTTPLRSRLPGPRRPGVIFKRSDSPFIGEGTQVSLTAEAGYTAQDQLTVPFRFQLPPMDSVARTSAFTWANFDVIGDVSGPQERTRPAGPRLRTTSLKTAFMDWEPNFQVWSPDLLDPVLAARELEQIVLKGVKFRLVVRNQQYFAHDDISWLAVMTQCVVTEQAGEPDTRYLDMAFQEYKPSDVERQSIHNELGPWVHKIASGDTLYKVAERYYHRNSWWQVIAKANPHLTGLNPSGPLLAWGKRHHKTHITIPRKPSGPVLIASTTAAAGGVRLY